MEMGTSSNAECDRLNETKLDDYKEAIYKLFKYEDYKLRGSNGEFRCPFSAEYHEEEHKFCDYIHLLLHAIREVDSATGKRRAKHFAMARYLSIDLADEVKAEAQQPSSKRRRLDEDSTKAEMVAVDRVRELEIELEETNDVMNNLINRDRLSNDELQGARRELIKGLDDILRGNSVHIGIKNLGEIDSKVFISEMEKRFSPTLAVLEGVKLCSSWQEKLKNPQWYPFRVVEDNDGKPKRLLKEDDSSLQDLKKEWGQEIHDAVVKALVELYEYNPSGCYVIPDLWNFKENRRAKLDEVISYIIEAVKDISKMGSTSDINNSRSKGHKEIGNLLKMGSTSDNNNSEKESDISDSEIYEQKERIYELLKSCTYEVRGISGHLRCPFCFVEEEQHYRYLLRHALTVAEESTESAEQRANHSALAKYLVINLQDEFEYMEDLLHDRCERRNDMKEEHLKRLRMLYDDLQSSNNELIAKEREKNEELKRAREELIKGLNVSQSGNNFSIGIKKMGEIDVNAFKRGCRKRFPQKEAEIRAIAECSMWQEKLKNPQWHPFRAVRDDKGRFQSVVNDDDESLKGLKQEWGDEIYSAVVTAIKELHECSPNRRSAALEIWNFHENRKAKIEEVISYVFDELVPLKRRRSTRKTAAIPFKK